MNRFCSEDAWVPAILRGLIKFCEISAIALGAEMNTKSTTTSVDLFSAHPDHTCPGAR